MRSAPSTIAVLSGYRRAARRRKSSTRSGTLIVAGCYAASASHGLGVAERARARLRQRLDRRQPARLQLGAQRVEARHGVASAGRVGGAQRVGLQPQRLEVLQPARALAAAALEPGRHAAQQRRLLLEQLAHLAPLAWLIAARLAERGQPL